MRTGRNLPIPDRRLVAAAAVVLWVAVSPWLWGFADSHSAVANHVALVLGFGPLALLIVNLRAAAFVTLAAGIWLAVSPWLLGYATDNAAWLNELVTGMLLVTLCANAAGVSGPIRTRRGAARKRATSSTPVIADSAGSRS